MGVFSKNLNNLKLYIMNQNQLKHLLQKIKDEEDSLCIEKNENLIKDSNRMFVFLLDKLNEIKTEVLKNGFNSEEEEIYFFKKVKPEISGRILFYESLINIELSHPKSSFKEQIKYYEKQIKLIYRNFNDEFYRYILLERKDKDEIYFLRKNIDYNNISRDFFLSSIKNSLLIMTCF